MARILSFLAIRNNFGGCFAGFLLAGSKVLI